MKNAKKVESLRRAAAELREKAKMLEAQAAEIEKKEVESLVSQLMKKGKLDEIKKLLSENSENSGKTESEKTAESPISTPGEILKTDETSNQSLVDDADFSQS